MSAVRAIRLVEKLAVRMPRRIEAESLAVHEARHAAVRRLGSRWLNHPDYRFNPRHSYDPEVYGPARQPFLDAIAERARRDREANPAWMRAERFRIALGDGHGE